MDLRLHLLSDFSFAEGGGQPERGDRRLSGLAYTGDAVVQFGGRFVIDLETLAHDERLPLLFQHEHERTIGLIDRVDNDGRRLRIGGVVFVGLESDPLPREIFEKSARGFPYQMSVGIYEATVERVPEGKEIRVNGRRFTGPLEVLRRARLREISIVALGADPNTRAQIAARAQAQSQHEEEPMTEERNAPEGADTGAATERLSARIAELEAALASERERADAACEALEAHRRQVRLEAVKSLLAELGVEYSEEAAAPYLELTDEAFRRLSEQVRAASRAGDGRLFDDVGREAGGGGSAEVSLSATEIYRKRRAE